MKATDYFKYKIKNGEMTHEEALNEMLDLYDQNEKFIDNLIKKYDEQKKLSLKNLKIFENHPEYKWYDATFNNTLLFLWDLNDIKCRNEMIDKNN